MLEKFTSLRKLHEQSEDYHAKVKTDFFVEPRGSYASSVYVSVPFNIEIEYRDWGIKNIMLTLSRVVDVDLVLEDEEGTEKNMTIKVDLGQLPQEWVRGSGYAPIEMSLHMTTEGVIDYKKSYIELMFLKKD